MCEGRAAPERAPPSSRPDRRGSQPLRAAPRTAASAAGAGLALLWLAALPLRAAETPRITPQVEPVALPFKLTAMRGPGSEVALAVATSGLLPVARAPGQSESKTAAKIAATGPRPVVVVWGEGGGAVLSLEGDRLRTTLIGAEAVEGFAAAETPRGAVPGARRALDGPLSAYLTGPTRAFGGAPGQGAVLTLRERQPMGVTAEPKAVPVTTQTLTPDRDRVFAGRTPRIAAFDGRPAVVAVTAAGEAGSGLALALKAKPQAGPGAAQGAPQAGSWTLAAQTNPQTGQGPDGAPLALAAVADVTGAGQPQIVAIREPEGQGRLQLWRYADEGLSLAGEWPGYAGPAAGEEADLAAAVPGAGDAPADLALPVAGRAAIALVSLKGGSLRERLRAPLPAPAAFGIAVLEADGGAGTILVGLADGRLVAWPVTAP